ncbi:MAG: integrase, partial [Candidatus Bathyarchaeota archaeon]|nr:integrase [Candidatus Bathyarchaeota archaeon]
KKAFVSFVPADLVMAMAEREVLTSADEVQKLVQKRGLPLRFSGIREVHGTFMTRYLKPSEIDFLHGRVSSSVFMKHYFNPALIGDLRERVFKGVSEILEKVKVREA